MKKHLINLRSFLGLERNVLVMTVGRSLRSLGSGLWSDFLPKVLELLGANALAIGAFGTINSGFSTFYSYLGGTLSDRLGRGKLMIVSSAVALSGYVIYAVSPFWGLFILGSALITASVQFDFMGSMAMFGETVKGEKRAVSMAAVGLIALPVGMIAPPLGGLLMQSVGLLGGFRVGVILTIVLTLLAIFIQWRFYRLPPPASKRLSMDIRASWRAMNKALRAMLAANCLMAFGVGMFQLFLVLYLINVRGVSTVQYGLLQSVMLAASSLFSVPLGKLADKQAGVGRKRYVALAFLLIAVFPALVVYVPSSAWLWPVFALRGIRESFDNIRKTMVVDLAGEGERGKVIGLYFFLQSLAAFPASFIAGWLWTINPSAPFLVGSAISAVGFIVFLTVKGGAAKSNSDKIQG